MKSGAFAYQRFSPFGLAASVWSENMSKALRYAEDIDAGVIIGSICIPSSIAVPFGGMKGSGGGREFGSAFIDDYTEPSVMVVINHPENDAGGSTIPKDWTVCLIIRFARCVFLLWDNVNPAGVPSCITSAIYR